MLAQACDGTGFPVLIKASAGGGGEGTRACRSAAEVAAPFGSAAPGTRPSP